MEQGPSTVWGPMQSHWLHCSRAVVPHGTHQGRLGAPQGWTSLWSGGSQGQQCPLRYIEKWAKLICWCQPLSQKISNVPMGTKRLGTIGLGPASNSAASFVWCFKFNTCKIDNVRFSHKSWTAHDFLFWANEHCMPSQWLSQAMSNASFLVWYNIGKSTITVPTFCTFVNRKAFTIGRTV